MEGGYPRLVLQSGVTVPFVPKKILILTDNAKGYCGKVVPSMVEMLEARAFIVDTHEINDGPVDVSSYSGIVLGSPVYGMGLKGVGPTPALTEYVTHSLPDLDDHKIAVFCVYEVRPGMTLDRMKGMTYEKGAELIAAHGFWVGRPMRGAHIIPAECMVRVV
jgi:hypothetical protein